MAACMRVAAVGWEEGNWVRICMKVESVRHVDALDVESEEEGGVKEIPVRCKS